MDSPNKFWFKKKKWPPKNKMTAKSQNWAQLTHFLSYRVQILHGSSYGLSQQIMKEISQRGKKKCCHRAPTICTKAQIELKAQIEKKSTFAPAISTSYLCYILQVKSHIFAKIPSRFSWYHFRQNDINYFSTTLLLLLLLLSWQSMTLWLRLL